jgi:predicted N-acyltransferase
MPDGSEFTYNGELISSLSQISAQDWDACAGQDNPFLSHAFLNALEISGCVNAETGWQPCHIIIRNGSNKIVGLAPLYLKSHSMGEYVFDHGWAQAYERAGGQYYPKLLSAIPFTPVTGPRLMVHPDVSNSLKPKILIALLNAMRQIAQDHGASGVHINFPDLDLLPHLEKAGFAQRLSHQFHWINRGYETFDDFLNDLSSRKRKNIRKERAKITQAGLNIEIHTGDDLRAQHWDDFYHFYRDTYDRKWGRPYLTRQFFDILQDQMADRVALVLAYHEGRTIAGALNLIGSDALYGRNWGADGAYKFLHFECCYYQAIDFAIAHKLNRVEAGTQGEHKLQRGYLPIRTYSAHWLADAGLHSAVADFLNAEQRAEEDYISTLMAASPFKQIA